MMKKHGKFCVTLAIFILILIPAISAQVTDDEDEIYFPEIYIETEPQTPTAGIPWIFTLIVDHGVPEEVTVIAPPLSSSISLDRLMKTPRVTDTHVQTAVQFRFLPNTPGRYVLESFTVITPYGITETQPYILEIQGSGTGRVFPRVVWEGAPAQMTAGERTALALHITDWNSGRLSQEFFMPEVPRGVILELLPLSAEERSRGIALKLNLIPLEGNFRLPARTLRYENTVFEIPALNIRVTGAVIRNTEINPPEQNTASLNEEISDNAYAVFPNFELSPDRLFFGKIILEKHWYDQCENIYRNARDLWDSGDYAGALAELRQNEREHPAGALLQPIRREAEENLMFFNTENENRWRRRLLLALSFFVLFLVIVVPSVCFAFIRNSFQRKAALLFAVVLALVGFAYIYIFLDSRTVFGGSKSSFGVTKETSVRRTADFNGEELFSFREGQPVMIMLNSGTWVFIKANDSTGSSGWVPAENVIFY